MKSTHNKERMQRDFIPAALPIIGDEERAAVDAVLASGMLAQGPEVASFEREFSASLLDGRHAVAVNSGTAGLHLGLLACGVGPGDEVVVPSFTFAATANAVALTGATPVFADIEPNYYSMDLEHAKSLISPRTKGIMPVHLYGHPFDASAFLDLASEHGLDLYEDAAQAHGASLKGKKVGTFGKFAMFSLYPTKNMTAGEGGINSTMHSDVDRMLRLLRNQGMEQQYSNEIVGFNARMTDLHAAIGRVQLRKLSEWTLRRQSNAKFFDENLPEGVPPAVSPEAVHVYHQYTIRVPEDRDGLVRALRDEYSIGAGVYYPTPVHRLPSFQTRADLPQTEAASREVLSLPVHPSLTKGELEYIANAVLRLLKAGA